MAAPVHRGHVAPSQSPAISETSHDHSRAKDRRHIELHDRILAVRPAGASTIGVKHEIGSGSSTPRNDARAMVRLFHLSSEPSYAQVVSDLPLSVSGAGSSHTTHIEYVKRPTRSCAQRHTCLKERFCSDRCFRLPRLHPMELFTRSITFSSSLSRSPYTHP